MGLFSFLKKDDNGKTLHECLEQFPGWYLYNETIKSLWIDIHDELDNNYEYAPVGIKTDVKVEYLTMSPFYKRDFVKAGNSIPKKYLEERISLVELLEIATNNGHFESPFLLFLFYQFGLDKLQLYKRETPAKMVENRDVKKAAVYRELARSRGSLFEKAYTYIEENGMKVREDVPVEQCEMDIIQMFTPSDEVKAMFEYGLDEFRKIGCFVLAGLCQYGFSYALGETAVYVVRLLREKDYENPDLYKLLEGYAVYNKNYINHTVIAIIKELTNRANGGDDSATYAMQNFDLKPL